jgi:hypothetical protein
MPRQRLADQSRPGVVIGSVSERPPKSATRSRGQKELFNHSLTSFAKGTDSASAILAMTSRLRFLASCSFQRGLNGLRQFVDEVHVPNLLFSACEEIASFCIVVLGVPLTLPLPACSVICAIHPSKMLP